jgi:hypothetical protein
VSFLLAKLPLSFRTFSREAPLKRRLFRCARAPLCPRARARHAY